MGTAIGICPGFSGSLSALMALIMLHAIIVHVPARMIFIIGTIMMPMLLFGSSWPRPNAAKII